MAAVPFLYLVSVPPVCIMTHVWGKAPSMDPFAPMPYLHSGYYQPYRWLRDHTALGTSLNKYEEMWLNVL